VASNVFGIVYIFIAILLLYIGLKKETAKWKIIGELLAILVLVVGISIELSKERINIFLILALTFALAALGTVVYRMVKVFLR
jgi:hypothetical protein